MRSWCVGVIILLIGGTCDAKELNEYFEWSPPKYGYALHLGEMELGDANFRLQLAIQSGIRPAAVVPRSTSHTLAIGCFQTALEVACEKHNLAKFESGVRWTTTTLVCAQSHYDNLTTSVVIRSYLKRAIVDGDMETQKFGNLLPPNLVEDLNLYNFARSRLLAVSDYKLKTDLIDAINCETSSPLTSILILALADEEFERFGTTKLLENTCASFCKGHIAVTDWSELELCFRYYDYVHEFKKDPYLSYALLKAVLNLESTNSNITAKKKRAIVELTALSREMVTRGIGSFTGACYWWQLFKEQGHSELSHAAAVINLMLIENYFDDNMTKLLSNPASRDEFSKWCKDYHKRYAGFKRERAFLCNLQMAVYSVEPEKGIELAYEIKKMLPLRDDEYGFWAGEVFNFLPGIFLSASKKALTTGNVSAAEEFSALAAETQMIKVSRVANHHSVFEN